MLKKKLKSFIEDDSGAVMVLAAMGLVVFLGCMTLVIDAGMFYSERAKASNAVDAAVLAGVRELPDDPDKAKTVAMDYAQSNGLKTEREDPEHPDVIFKVGDDYKSITGDVDKDMGSFFGRVIGIDTWDVKAHAKARIGPAKIVSGFIPVGVTEGAIAASNNGQEKTVLRDEPGNGVTGWYGYLNLESVDDQENLLQDLAAYIKYGYPGNLSQDVEVKQGVPARQPTDAFAARLDACPHDPQCTYEHCEIYGFERECPRLVVVPIGYPTDMYGDKIDVDYLIANDQPIPPVFGFHVDTTAVFLLEEVNRAGGNCSIEGRFVSYNTSVVVSGEIDDSVTTYGVYAAELCE